MAWGAGRALDSHAVMCTRVNCSCELAWTEVSEARGKQDAARLPPSGLHAERLPRRDVRSDNVVLGAGARQPVLDVLAGRGLGIDCNLLESRRLERGDEIVRARRARNSAGERSFRLKARREILLADHVADGEPATGLEHAEGLATHLQGGVARVRARRSGRGGARAKRGDKTTQHSHSDHGQGRVAQEA